MELHGARFPPPFFQKPASIPSQRALIVFRDGKKHLPSNRPSRSTVDNRPIWTQHDG